jgi:hypothetical protein
VEIATGGRTSSGPILISKGPILKRSEIESDYRFQLIDSLQAFLNINQVNWIDLDIEEDEEGKALFRQQYSDIKNSFSD